GIATFWLPIYQLTTDETKAVLRAFHNVFPNTSVWATCDLEWIMTGIKEPLHRRDEQSARALWNDAAMRADLARIGIEVPEQMSGSNWLAELDLYLRHTRLRTPVLAVRDSDEFRLTLAEKLANNSRSLPVEALHDLVAGALARRDLSGAIQLLESEKDHGFSN